MRPLGAHAWLSWLAIAAAMAAVIALHAPAPPRAPTVPAPDEARPAPAATHEALARVAVPHGEPGAPPPTNDALHDALCIEGMLLAPDGAPTAGDVRVWESAIALGDKPFLLPGARGGELFTRRAPSDAAGRFRIAVPRGGSYQVLGMAAAFASSKLAGVTVDSSQRARVTLQLLPYGTIRGVVRCADGTPLPGACLLLQPENGAGAAPLAKGPDAVARFGAPARTEADHSGAFCFPHVHPDATYTVSCIAPRAHFSPWETKSSRQGVIAGAVLDLTVADALAKAVHASGRVFRATALAPLAEFEVRLVVPRGGYQRTVTTQQVRDAGGRFAIDDTVLADSYWLAFAAKGLASEMRGPFAAGPIANDLVVELQELGTLEVHVLDASGCNAPHVLVKVTAEQPIESIAPRITDACGTCRFEGLAPGKYRACTLAYATSQEVVVEVLPGSCTRALLTAPR